MQKDSKKIIMNVICAFALFTLFTMFCSMLCNITASFDPLLDKYKYNWDRYEQDIKILEFMKCSYLSCFIALIPVFGLFISKLFVRNKIINILENIFVIILIALCVGFLILGSNSDLYGEVTNGDYAIILAQKIELTSLLATACLYEVYLAYDLIKVFKEEKEAAKKEIEE